tara:strand:+ start:3691 stop:4101 length:411 start_codon:yes stop_codon:yes gene_type:complete
MATRKFSKNLTKKLKKKNLLLNKTIKKKPKSIEKNIKMRKKTKKNRKKKGGAPKRKHDQLTEETLEKLPTKPIKTKELTEELLNKQPNDNEEELSRIDAEANALQQIRSKIENSRASPLNILKKKRSESSLSNRSN